MVPVCDKRYHIYNRFRHFWAEIKKLWNYPFRHKVKKTLLYMYLAKFDVQIKWFYTHYVTMNMYSDYVTMNMYGDYVTMNMYGDYVTINM